MRYDTPVYFQEITPGEYKPRNGDYREDTIQETKRLASVMNTGEETLKLLYGSIKQGSLTIQLQNHYNAPFSRIRIGETIYQADVSRKLTGKAYVYCIGGAGMPKVKIVGVEKLQKKLRKNVDMEEVKRTVRKHGSQLEAKAKRKAEFKGHYEWSKEAGGEVFVKPSGNLKNSIRTEVRNGGMTAEIEPTSRICSLR